VAAPPSGYASQPAGGGVAGVAAIVIDPDGGAGAEPGRRGYWCFAVAGT
jgi:hypothetical protein